MNVKSAYFCGVPTQTAHSTVREGSSKLAEGDKQADPWELHSMLRTDQQSTGINIYTQGPNFTAPHLFPAVQKKAPSLLLHPPWVRWRTWFPIHQLLLLFLFILGPLLLPHPRRHSQAWGTKQRWHWLPNPCVYVCLPGAVRNWKTFKSFRNTHDTIKPKHLWNLNEPLRFPKSAL